MKRRDVAASLKKTIDAFSPKLRRMVKDFSCESDIQKFKSTRDASNYSIPKGEYTSFKRDLFCVDELQDSSAIGIIRSPRKMQVARHTSHVVDRAESIEILIIPLFRKARTDEPFGLMEKVRSPSKTSKSRQKEVWEKFLQCIGTIS